MEKLIFISLFALSFSIKGQSIDLGMKKTVVSVKNSNIQQKENENTETKKTNLTRVNSSLIRTIHSVSDFESKKYNYEPEVKRMVNIIN